MVMGLANLAMATGNIGHDGVGVNPLRGQNNVQGSCDMGSFPHELSGYRHVSDDGARSMFETMWGTTLQSGPRPAHPQHVRRSHRGHVPGAVRPGRGHRPVRPEHPPRHGRAAVARPAHRAGPVHQRDRQAGSRVLPRHLVPREGRHVHQRRTAHQPGPSGHASSLRQAGVGGRRRAVGGARFAHELHVVQRHHGRDRRADTDVRRRLVRLPRRGRQRAVAVQRGQARWARRSCTRTPSSAVSAASSRRRTCPPKSAPPGGSRCC